MGGLTGGRQCGAVRYRLTSPPEDAGICHGRTGRKASGGGFMAFALRTPGDLALERVELRRVRSSDLDGRGFRAARGTPPPFVNSGTARVGLAIGRLDSPGPVAPNGRLGTESAVAWIDECLATGKISLEARHAGLGVVQVGSRQQPDRD